MLCHVAVHRHHRGDCAHRAAEAFVAEVAGGMLAEKAFEPAPQVRRAIDTFVRGEDTAPAPDRSPLSIRCDGAGPRQAAHELT